MRQVITETYENDDQLDITYVVIVWIAFLPTVVVPCFFAHWIYIGSITNQGIKKSIANTFCCFKKSPPAGGAPNTKRAYRSSRRQQSHQVNHDSYQMECMTDRRPARAQFYECDAQRSPQKPPRRSNPSVRGHPNCKWCKLACIEESKRISQTGCPGCQEAEEKARRRASTSSGRCRSFEEDRYDSIVVDELTQNSHSKKEPHRSKYPRSHDRLQGRQKELAIMGLNSTAV